MRTPTPFKRALILSACTLMSLSNGLARADGFGIPGQSGAAGANGYSGPDGQSASVVATGQAQSFNLRGQDGGNGGNGQPGGRAMECRQPEMVRADLFGAPGGSGGSGGYGGNGGSGGSLTVYYSDIANLKQLSIDSTPGRGGNAGYGANGEEGCRCERREWSVPVKVCHEVTPPPPHAAEFSTAAADTGRGGPAPAHSNNPAPGHAGGPQPQPEPRPQPAPVPPPQPVTVCDIVPERHVCQDGRPGDNGANFAGGSAGQYGSATLIQSLTPLTPTNPAGSAQVGSLPSSTTLTIDNWSSAAGAVALFAPGSQISDTYRFWAGRKTVQTSVVWNASTPQSSCTSQAIAVQVNGAGQVSANIENGSVWAELGVTYAADGSATVSVNKAVPANQTTQLSGVLSGTDSGVVMTLNDAAKVSGLVNTQVHAKVISDAILNHTRYDDNVPENFLVINDSTIVVEIGKLPGIPAGDIKKGKKLKVQLTITRSLGGQSATQEIDVDQKL